MTAAGRRPTWVRWCGRLTIGAAVPTIVWRALAGLGLPLGSPAGWRAREQLPGAGTAYVLGLSAVQLLAAAATLVLFHPGADRIPFASGRRWPRGLVVGAAAAGAAALAVICVLSIVHWSSVNPFALAPATGWAVLCWTCYCVALAWPPLLAATTVGYARARR